MRKILIKISRKKTEVDAMKKILEICTINILMTIKAAIKILNLK